MELSANIHLTLPDDPRLIGLAICLTALVVLALGLAAVFDPDESTKPPRWNS